jgi:hypothetical protein
MLKLFGAAPGEKPYSAMVAAGAVSGAFGYFFCCPIYQVKTLAQAEHGKLVDGFYTTGNRVGKSPEYSPWHKGLAKLRAEGTLFRGVGAVATRGAFFSAGN